MVKTDPGTRWLVILDHDKKEFQIEGPMWPDIVTSWNDVMVEALGQGRNIQFYTELGDKDRADMASFINGHWSYPETAIFRRPKSN
jgi:hypothetical protein